MPITEVSLQVVYCQSLRNRSEVHGAAAGTKPHFTTIVKFVSTNTEAYRRCHRVLLVYDERGLIGREHFAIDGCKLPTDASKEWSGTHEELKKKSDKMRARAARIEAKHVEADSGKNKKSGHHNKELQTIDFLLKNADKIDVFLQNNGKRTGHSRGKKEVQSNITDNESSKMWTSKGTMQGMTCVTAADEKHQVIVEAQAYGVGQEQITLKPMVEKIKNHFEGDVFSVKRTLLF